jgi:Putative Ig domain
MRWNPLGLFRGLSLACTGVALLLLGGCGGGDAGASTAKAALSIAGTPPTATTAGVAYNFTPSVSGAGGAALTFSISGRPAWATFDTTTGKLSGTPSSADVGTYSNVVISVSDGTASVSLPAYSIMVAAMVSSTLTISGTPPNSISAGTQYQFTPIVAGSSGGTLVFSIGNIPPWATFNTSTGMLSGTPAAANAGAYANVQISVSNGTASASLTAFTVTVTQTGQGVVQLSWTQPTQNTDGSALTGLAGYHLHYGNSAGSMGQTIDVNDPSATTYAVAGLNSGTYFLSLSAYTGTGSESVQTSPVSKTVP